MTKPSRPPEAVEDEGYQGLILAIVHRAWLDATGRCDPLGPNTRDRLQADARAWFADEQAVAGLLELAGYDARVVLTRLRRALVK